MRFLTHLFYSLEQNYLPNFEKVINFASQIVLATIDIHQP